MRRCSHFLRFNADIGIWVELDVFRCNPVPNRDENRDDWHNTSGFLQAKKGFAESLAIGYIQSRDVVGQDGTIEYADRDTQYCGRCAHGRGECGLSLSPYRQRGAVRPGCADGEIVAGAVRRRLSAGIVPRESRLFFGLVGGWK
jgi:hypothetical protein